MDDLRLTGFQLGDGVYAGFTIQELRESGGIALSVLAAQRKIAGISASNMALDGFTFKELQDAGYDLYGMLNSHLEDVIIDICKCINALIDQERIQKINEESQINNNNNGNDVLLIDHRIIDPLVEILRVNNVSNSCLIHIAQTLGVLANSADNRTLITSNSDTIPSLVDLLRSDTNDECKEAITWALGNLCIDHSENMIAIAVAGAIDPLVDQLLYGIDSYKIAAAQALCNLACDNSNTTAIASAGAIHPLVKLLSHENMRLN